MLPDPRTHPFSGLGLLVEIGFAGKSHIYDLARRGELPIPVIRVGTTYRVRTRDIWKLAGIPIPGETSEEDSERIAVA
jgi:hypothetical protein